MCRLFSFNFDEFALKSFFESFMLRIGGVKLCFNTISLAFVALKLCCKGSVSIFCLLKAVFGGAMRRIVNSDRRLLRTFFCGFDFFAKPTNVSVEGIPAIFMIVPLLGPVWRIGFVAIFVSITG